MGTILIIEDRAADRARLAGVLRAADHHVMETADGAAALELLETLRIDLVISGIVTRSIDGYELEQRLRQGRGAVVPPVVFYTASHHELDASALAHRCGVPAILTRSSGPEAILTTVTRLLTGGSPGVGATPAGALDPAQGVGTAADGRTDDAGLGTSWLAALLELAQQISAERDPQELLRMACVAARDITLARHAVAGVLGRDGRIAEVFTSGLPADDAWRLAVAAEIERLWSTAVDERRALRRPAGRRAVRRQAADLAPSLAAPRLADVAAWSCLIVPIGSPDQVHALLALCNKLGSREFSDADEAAALALAAQAAVAYENAQRTAGLLTSVAALEREVAERLRAEAASSHRARLAVFRSRVGTALMTSPSVPAMLEACGQAAVEHLEVAVARIWLCSSTRDALFLAATAGGGGVEPGSAAPVLLTQPGAAAIARDRSPKVIDPLEVEPFPGDAAWLRARGVIAFGGWPLRVDERLVGLLGLYTTEPLTDEASAAIFGASGEIAVGIERRHLEDRLRENEERTTFALAAARMGVWELDLVRNRLVSADTVRSLFGMGPDESVSDVDAMVARIHVDDRAMVLRELRRSVAKHRDYNVGFRVRWPDGTLHWIDGRGHLLYDETGVPVKVLGVSVDVSDRKALEEQLLQAQKMEGIGQLAGGVAHDFNNLLTAILGYSALLEDSLPSDDPRRLDVQEIVKATDRAAALTRQLLAFSRKQLLEPTLVHLNSLIRDMTQLLKRLISEDIELCTDLAPQLSTIRADAGQIQQVVMNLAVNARDAMPSGGQLTIRTANVDLDDAYLLHHAVAEPGHYVMVAVSDTGHGIPAHVKGRLFEPFFTTKEKGRGTGLGLATVYGIVQQSGGYIWVYSEPGQGATFKVYLPAAGDQTRALPLPSEVKAAHGIELVAIVEDEEAVRRLASVVLSRAGYQVIEAADPSHAEVMFAAQTSPINLLVTDVVMPGASGPALYQRLLGRQPDLRVLYMSGYTDDAVIREGRLKPGEAFLQKPFTGERLLRKVREVLDGSSRPIR